MKYNIWCIYLTIFTADVKSGVNCLLQMWLFITFDVTSFITFVVVIKFGALITFRFCRLISNDQNKNTT